jgi:hypothetical protein
MMKPHRKTETLTALSFAAALVAAGGGAASAAAATPGGVARVSVAQGGVNVARGDATSKQVAAGVNAPLLAGDTLATTRTGRAEVQFDGGSALRLEHGSQARFVSLGHGAQEAQLAQGSAEVSVLHAGGARPLIDTRTAQVEPVGVGSYRVGVMPNGASVVTVRSGRAAVWTPEGRRVLVGGQTLVGGRIVTGYRGDDFDRFYGGRDVELNRWYRETSGLGPARYARYQSIVGYNELAGYGRWVNEPGYGPSWIPTQNANWAPYQNGSWAWEPGYGYTWVGNEPWGYAPYHYGSWYQAPNDGGWAWQPPTQYQPDYGSTWAPALVGFLSNGLNGGGFGNGLDALAQLGWVALAPGEQYQSYYGWGNPGGYGGYQTGYNGAPYGYNGSGNGGYGYGYPTGYNGNYPYNAYGVNGCSSNAIVPSPYCPGYYPVSGPVYVRNIYRNTIYRNAITIVRVRDFNGGRFAYPLHVWAGGASRLAVVRGGLPIAPTAGSLAFNNRPVEAVRLAPAIAENRFAGNPIAFRRIPFSEQQANVTHIVSALPKVASLQGAPIVRGVPAVQSAPVAHAAPVNVERAPEVIDGDHIQNRVAPDVQRAPVVLHAPEDRPAYAQPQRIHQLRPSPEQRVERYQPVPAHQHFAPERPAATHQRWQPLPRDARPEHQTEQHRPA